MPLLYSVSTGTDVLLVSASSLLEPQPASSGSSSTAPSARQQNACRGLARPGGRKRAVSRAVGLISAAYSMQPPGAKRRHPILPLPLRAWAAKRTEVGGGVRREAVFGNCVTYLPVRHRPSASRSTACIQRASYPPPPLEGGGWEEGSAGEPHLKTASPACRVATGQVPIGQRRVFKRRRVVL